MTLGITPVKSSLVALWSGGQQNSQSLVSFQEKQKNMKEICFCVCERAIVVFFTNSTVVEC